FLVSDEREMAEAIRAAGFLNPETCRAAARERFDASKMAQRYIDVFYSIADDRNRAVYSGLSTPASTSMRMTRSVAADIGYRPPASSKCAEQEIGFEHKWKLKSCTN